MQGSSESDASRAAETVTSVRLCEVAEEEEGGSAKRRSVSESCGRLLVVPQATLGGKLKGRSLQYHGNVSREEGEALYRTFCRQLENRMGAAAESGGKKVLCCLYGARQVLAMDTNGPFTHVFDL